MQAPVSVARSTIASTFSSTANDSPSASTRRPSASVLRTSTVVPVRAVNTSPGFTAVPLGRLSVHIIQPTTSVRTSSPGSSAMVASTVAAPAMSVFIVIMPAAGLSDRPPESKVMPLPTRATRPRLRPFGL